MQIDPRLNDIDDCLYRVAIRVLIVQNDKVLLIQENSDNWWALPGGGVDHGETVESSLLREVEEELGVPAQKISSDFQIVYFNIGNVVNNVPRMNLFFKPQCWRYLSRKLHMSQSGSGSRKMNFYSSICTLLMIKLCWSE